MHGNPGRWFKEKTIPFDNMISPEKLKEMKEKIIDKEMPEARVYLPAQIIFRGDRINYTHANDASEHFISFY
jgi:regulatory protein YycH of two-component signal transduction system YycFG